MSDPKTDEELRMWAIQFTSGDIEAAKAIVEFVRPSKVEKEAPAKRRTRTIWTDEMCEMARRDHAAGDKPRAVAAALRERFGGSVTANAVSSYWANHGLKGRASPVHLAALKAQRGAGRKKAP